MDTAAYPKRRVESVSASDDSFTQQLQRCVQRIKPARLTVDAVDDLARPDPRQRWIPETLSPLHQSAAIGALNDQQRLRYNQLYALHMAEQFIWLERELVIKPLIRLLRQTSLAGEIRTVISSFLNDEHHHNNALWRLLQRADPALYPRAQHQLFKPPARVWAWAALARSWPARNQAWNLFIGAAEEHTILISRMYSQCEDCDASFAAVFRAHAIDEARHCLMDEALGLWLEAQQQPWQRRASNWILMQMFNAYYDVRWGNVAPINRLCAEQALPESTRASLASAALAARDQPFRAQLFSAENAPICHRRAQQHSGLAQAIAQICGS